MLRLAALLALGWRPAITPTAGASDPSCTASVQWHPNIQLHDMEGAGDMGSRGNTSAAACASWCCATPSCVAFFHTTNASMWNNNCGDTPCCWIKPSFNTTRLNDTCLGDPTHKPCTGTFTSGLIPARALPSPTPVQVFQPQRLRTELPTNRTRLGLPGDYKPWAAQLANGDVLIVAFASMPDVNGKPPPTEEHAVFFRSTNQGRTYSDREYRTDLNGREYSLNVLDDGTLLMPNALLGSDKNYNGTYSWVHSVF